MNEIFTPPTVKVTVEPERVTGRPAGFWIRFLAYIIDSLILNVMIVAIVMVVALLSLPLRMMLEESTADAIGGFLVLIAMIILMIGYYAVGWSKYGTTLGKKLFKLRVVDAKTNTNISLGKGIGRLLSYIISAMPFYLGFFWIGWDTNKEGFHDKICQTRVIVED